MNFTLLGRNSIVAKSKSGKSELLLYLLKLEAHLFKHIFVISSTNDLYGFYNEIVPKRNIMSDFDDDWLKNLLGVLTIKKKKDKSFNDQLLLIFDDMGDNKKLQKDANFFKMFYIGASFKFISYYIKSICESITKNSKK
jgi:hypothetical protein